MQDIEIASGAYGWAPPGRERLILGHESLGRVLDPGTHTGLRPGDLIVGIVRRPDPVPCPNCAVGATYHFGSVADIGFEPDVIIEAIAVANRDWLEQLISRRIQPQDISAGLHRGPDDIKVTVEFRT